MHRTIARAVRAARCPLTFAALLSAACGPQEADLGSIGQAVTTSCAPTPTTTTTVGSKTYYFFDKSTSLNWATAKADCAAMGGQLATPTSDAENTAIFGLISGNRLFLGAYQNSGQSSPSAGWLGITGSSLSYSSWSAGEPNDSDGRENSYQNCAAMNSDSTSWDDVSCGNLQSYDYVCEFSTAPTTCGSDATCSLASGASTYSCACASGSTYNTTVGACVSDTVKISLAQLQNTSKVPGTYTWRGVVVGSGFDSKTKVTLGGSSTSLTYSSSTSLTFTPGTVVPGWSYTLVVTNSNGASASTTVLAR